MTYVCPWCGQPQDEYVDYTEHIDMHASIDFLNGKSVICQLCNAILTTFEAWQKHRQIHSDADMKDECSQQPKKKAKTNNTDQVLSPLPGPSHWSPPQIGRGASEVEDASLSYSFEKVGEKRLRTE